MDTKFHFENHLVNKEKKPFTCIENLMKDTLTCIPFHDMHCHIGMWVTSKGTQSHIQGNATRLHFSIPVDGATARRHGFVMLSC